MADLVALADDLVAKAQQLRAALTPTPAPAFTYHARTDRESLPKPAPLALGPAGFTFTDPVFGSRIVRVTDERTDNGGPCRVPSNALTSAWNCDGSMFYTIGAGGGARIYHWDGTTATPVTLPVPGYIEPCWSYVDPMRLYVGAGPNSRTVRAFHADTGAIEDVFDADAINGLIYPLAETYLSNLLVADNDAWVVAFGGHGQDWHYLVRHSSGQVLDTTGARIPYYLHALGLERSGRFVVIFPRGSDVKPVGAPALIWDTQTGGVTPVNRLAGGHWALGYGAIINADCCTSSAWDALQWQYRTIADPTTTRDLVTPITPHVKGRSDHTNWRSAKAGEARPILSATFRSIAAAQLSPDELVAATPWRAWDDEILALATDGSDTVWRFAHHQSAFDGDFWNQCMAHIDPTGRYALFHSNFGRTLGTFVEDNVTKPGRIVSLWSCNSRRDD
jgi:hypothetical protein